MKPVERPDLRNVEGFFRFKAEKPAGLAGTDNARFRLISGSVQLRKDEH